MSDNALLMKRLGDGGRVLQMPERRLIAARIAELVAERDSHTLTNENLIGDLNKARARIAELEAEVARLTAAAVDASFRFVMVPQDDGDRSQEFVGGRRIAELEAEVARLTLPDAMTHEEAIAELAKTGESVGGMDVPPASLQRRSPQAGHPLACPPLSEGMETTEEERAKWATSYHSGEPWMQRSYLLICDLNRALGEITRLKAELATMEEAALRNGIALQHEAREQEREACARWHDEEEQACYRRLANPESYDDAGVWNTRAAEHERSAAAIRGRPAP